MSMSENDEAILAIKSRIATMSRAGAPIEWAKHQLELGDALMASGRPPAMERVREAWQAYGDAMEACSPDQDIEIWTKAAAGLASAWVAIGSAPNGPRAVLGKAVGVLQEASLKYPRRNNPATWATIQVRLGQALLVCARDSNDAPSARRARTRAAEALVGLYNAAEIFNESMYPDRWEKLKSIIDDAHSLLDSLNAEIPRYAAAQ
jgi:hypothetical protein